MKKFILTVLIIALLLVGLMLLLSKCGYDVRGHETYKEIEDYEKAFKLTNIKYFEEAKELFPEDLEGLMALNFYCEWELGLLGDADVEMSLSVQYGEGSIKEELERLKELADGKVVYDTTTFEYPAYVLMLGHEGANWYALVDESSFTIHYVMLQLIDKDRIDISHDFLPKGYYDFGYVKNQSYSVLEEETSK